MGTTQRCPTCAGSLPAPRPPESSVTCPICGTHVKVAAAPVPPGATATAAAPDVPRFVRLYLAERGRKKPVATAILVAARAALPSLNLTERVASAVSALAHEFKSSSSADIRDDGAALHRLLEAYLAARQEVARGGTAELALPSLGATALGPKHLERKLTAAEVERLESQPIR